MLRISGASPSLPTHVRGVLRDSFVYSVVTFSQVSRLKFCSDSMSQPPGVITKSAALFDQSNESKVDPLKHQFHVTSTYVFMEQKHGQ